MAKQQYGTRLPSDRPSLPPELEEILRRTLAHDKLLEARIESVKTEVLEELSDVKLKLASVKSSQHSETTKIIVSGVVAVVTAVTGSRLMATEAPQKTEVLRSEFDLEREKCNKRPTQEERDACHMQVYSRFSR